MLTLTELQHKRERHAARRRILAPRHLRNAAHRWDMLKTNKPMPKRESNLGDKLWKRKKL
jgi:hypothetical protein